MKKTDGNLTMLNVVFVTCLVIANVVTSKVIDTGIVLFDTSVMIPGAALTYAMTFLCTDIIGEIWGRSEANKAVWRGFFAQLLALCLIVLTQYLPAVDPTAQNAYERLLGQSVFFVFGSMTAYLISQSWDVWIFHKIRQYFDAEPNHRWIWNNISTATSQIFDTAIFITIAFGVGFGWMAQGMYAELIAMIVGQYLLKFALALLDTPFFYIFTRRK